MGKLPLFIVSMQLPLQTVFSTRYLDSQYSRFTWHQSPQKDPGQEPQLVGRAAAGGALLWGFLQQPMQQFRVLLFTSLDDSSGAR